MIWARLRLSLLLFRRERAVFLLLHLCRPAASVETSGLGGTASSLGKQFTEGFDSGISKKRWIWTAGRKKHRNAVQCPHFVFIRLRKASRCGLCQRSEYFADGHRFILKTKVKTPYQSAVNQSSSWGAATVKGYSAGQNAKDTGTSQYVSTHINKPFVQSRDSANGWGQA